MDTPKSYESISHPENGGAEVDRRWEAFKRLVPHLRGALWWGQNDTIKDRFSAFNQNDNRAGHPLLSLRKDEIRLRGDGIPMLFGTSGLKMSSHGKRCCIDVVGLTKRDPGHHTYFGSIIEPAVYSVAEMLDGVTAKSERVMVPNWDKPVVSDDEMKMVDDFCLIHQL